MNARSTGIGWIISLLVVALLATASYAEDMKAAVRVTGGGTYDYVVVGGNSGAQDGFDYVYDTVSPGPSMNETYIYTNIPHPEWDAIKSDFRADIRSSDSNQEWVVDVSTNLPAGTQLSINLDGERTAIPEAYALTVTDPDTGQVVTLDGSSTYQFQAPGSDSVKQLILQASYTPPVVEDPIVEDPVIEDPVIEDPVGEDTDPDDTANNDETPADTSANGGDDAGEADNGNNDLALSEDSSSGTFYLAAAGEGARAGTKEHPRAVPPPPVIGSLPAGAQANMGKRTSLGGNGTGMAHSMASAHGQSSDSVTCMSFKDSSGDTILYCGKDITEDAMLSRVRGGRPPLKGVKFISDSSSETSESALARVIRSLGQGLNVSIGLLLTKDDEPSIHNEIQPDLFASFDGSFTYRIINRGIDQIVQFSSKGKGHN